MSRARDLSRLANSNAFSVDTNLNVGIGSTTPDAKLDVVGIVSATAFHGDGSNLSGIAAGYWEKTDAGINTSSKVGIGTTNPIGARLVVGGATPTGTGGLRVTDSDSGFNSGVEGALVDYDGTAARYGHINGASGSAKPIQFMVGSAEKSKIDTAGNLFVGTANSSFLKPNGGGVGLGTISTTGRNAGVGTATGTIIYNSTENKVQYYNGSTWANLSSAFTATGGNIADGLEPGNGYKYHTFTSPGSFEITTGANDVEIVVVGGGGGGGTCNSGGGSDGGAGGGGGGVVLASYPSLGPGTYNITVGPGGTGGPAGPLQPGNPVNQQAGLCSPSKAAPYNGVAGTPGSDSIFGASSPTNIKLTAKGGGGGGSGPNAGNEDCGGSGGGAGSGGSNATNGGPALQPTQNPSFAGTLTTNVGNAGGNSPGSSPFRGAGGGGAGGAGNNGSSGGPGVGGNAVTLPTGFAAPVIGMSPLNPISRQFAAGGGGGDGGPAYQGTVAPGGSGGGGNGATQNVNATQGQASSGGGGGGGSGITGLPSTDSHGSGGNGGAGIVIVRYLA